MGCNRIEFLDALYILGMPPHHSLMLNQLSWRGRAIAPSPPARMLTRFGLSALSLMQIHRL
ncbi:MAG: hypothetical protein JWM14_333 [Chitinophagaceae bacterium]|nr:hypothetical protein [Chitinophagaceae bacterium]